VATPLSQASRVNRESNTIVVSAPVSSWVECNSLTSASVSPVAVGNVTNNSASGNQTQRRSASIKLDKFDGSTALETHLAKLKNCANYYGWIDYEQKCHLIVSLTGPSGQLLWNLTARDDAT